MQGIYDIIVHQASLLYTDMLCELVTAKVSNVKTSLRMFIAHSILIHPENNIQCDIASGHNIIPNHSCKFTLVHQINLSVFNMTIQKL